MAARRFARGDRGARGQRNRSADGATAGTGYQASLATVLREWGRIGCIGFGGPPAHIALLRQLCVDERGWLDAPEFEDAIAACNLLPGPASTQLAIFCAWRVRGRPGALVGGVAFIVPGLIVILALSALFLAGSPPLWVLGRARARAPRSPRSRSRRAGRCWARAGTRRRAAARPVAGVPGWPGVAAAATIGPGWSWCCSAAARSSWPSGRQPAAAAGTATAADAAGDRRAGARGGDAAAARREERRWAAAGARLTPRANRRAVLGAPLRASPSGGGVLASVAWVAFKVGALSFGGGFVIIPLMQADAVGRYHWMTGAQFLNAVALGQITPGPVVQTVAAVGYAAAGSAAGCSPPLVAFAPSFVFVLLGGRRFGGCAATSARGVPRRRGPAAIGAILGSAIPLTAALGQPWQYAVLAGAVVLLLALRRGVVVTLLSAAAVGLAVALGAGRCRTERGVLAERGRGRAYWSRTIAHKKSKCSRQAGLGRLAAEADMERAKAPGLSDVGLGGAVVIVTGAGSGIGAATARQLGAVGASVVLVGRRKDALEEVAGRPGRAGAVRAGRPGRPGQPGPDHGCLPGAIRADRRAGQQRGRGPAHAAGRMGRGAASTSTWPRTSGRRSS